MGVKIVIPEVLEMLKSGKTRKEIAQHYGMPLSAMKEKVFSHSDLKGRKTKKTYDIEVFDSAEDLEGSNQEQTQIESVDVEPDTPHITDADAEVEEVEEVEETVAPDSIAAEDAEESGESEGSDESDVKSNWN
jgi:hypothetical protein